MNIKKFTFEIDSAGDFEVVKFTVKAATREDADKFVLLINPSARLVNVEETDVVADRFVNLLPSTIEGTRVY